jgi:hypothetical protein
MERDDYLSNLREEDQAIASQLYDSLINLGYEVQPVGSVLEGDQNYDDIDLLATHSFLVDPLHNLYLESKEEFPFSRANEYPSELISEFKIKDWENQERRRMVSFGKKLEHLLGLEDSEIKHLQYDDYSQFYVEKEVDCRLRFEVDDTKLDISITQE